VWEGRGERFDLTALRCYRSLKDSKRLERSLATLGGGNHFIEIDTDEEGNRYLVIHSGSRNLGTQVAEHYQQIAVDLNLGKEDYLHDVDICQRFAMRNREKMAEILLADNGLVGGEAFLPLSGSPWRNIGSR